MLEVESERLTLLLSNGHRVRLAVLIQQLEREAGIIAVKFIVQHVAYCCAVDHQQGLACADTCALRRGTRVDRYDLGSHLLFPPF